MTKNVKRNYYKSIIHVIFPLNRRKIYIYLYT